MRSERFERHQNDYVMDRARTIMSENLLDTKIAIIGGGRFCKLFLQYLFDENFMDRSPNVLVGVY